MSPVLEFRFAPGLSRETLLLINVELCLIVATVMEDVVDEDNIEVKEHLMTHSSHRNCPGLLLPKLILFWTRCFLILD